MSRALARLFAQKFIQQPTVKAVQLPHSWGALHAGDWFPDTKLKNKESGIHTPLGFNMNHLLAHIAGERTYGHYMLDKSNMCKLFAFDIDLKAQPRSGNWVDFDNDIVHEYVNPLELWKRRSRASVPARNWYKYQMRSLAHKFAVAIESIDVQCAVAYSGSKGVHVYGFTGSMDAAAVRQGALLVLDLLDEFAPVRGKNFWEHKNSDPVHGFQNFSIEVFPKQTSLEGKSLGNLMRLPLGVNHKSPKDPTFFLDMTSPLAVLAPHSDPVKLLEGNSCFV
jgi:hypothetical protein